MRALFHKLLALLPPGSFVARALRLLIKALRLLQREGPGGVIRRLRSRPQAIAPYDLNAVPGQTVPFPAISVILLEPNPEVSLDEVRSWLAEQTMPAGLAIWNQTAQTLSFEELANPIPAIKEYSDLIHHLPETYICFASKDLIGQPSTYLETHLIALKTEDLAFTVCINGRDDQIQKKIEAGFLPNQASAPLFRQVVRKELVNNHLSLDPERLMECLGARDKAVIGKVLYQTRATRDDIQQFQYQPALSSLKIKMFDQHVILRKAKANNSSFIFDTHPVPSAIPVTETPCDLPTVLVIMPFLAVGGAERVALDMMRCLCHEIRFVIVTLENHDPNIGTTVESFRSITPYVYTARDFLMPHLLYSLMEYLFQRFCVETMYIANGANWIYDALTTLKSQFPKIRMVDQVYDHEAGWINRYNPAIANCFDANIGVNKKICQAYIEKGAPPAHAIQIENGVDLEEYDPVVYNRERIEALKGSLGIPSNKKVITFMARVHPQKRPLDFVDLARRCASDSALVFLFVGDGPLGTAVDQEIARANLTNVFRKSFYKPSSDIFAVSDVYVLPSEYEGMPMVILEAQAMGKPVVVTDAGNNRDVLSTTNGGVVVPVGDVAGLREGIYTVLENYPDPDALRQKIADHYSLIQMASRYKNVLLGLGE